MLPIECDWTHAFGLTGDGAVIAHEMEKWPGTKSLEGVVTDLRLLNIALREGAKRYRWIASFFPKRPNDAQACSMCSGNGVLPEPAVCYCGGAGWVPEDDTWVNGDRL